MTKIASRGRSCLIPTNKLTKKKKKSKAYPEFVDEPALAEIEQRILLDRLCYRQLSNGSENGMNLLITWIMISLQKASSLKWELVIHNPFNKWTNDEW